MVAPARRTNWIAFMRPDRWSASLWINQSIKICRNKNIATAKGIWTVVCSLLTRPHYLVFVLELFVFLTQSIPTETKNEWFLWLLGLNELSVVVNVKSFALNSIQSSGILIKERICWSQRFFGGRHVLSHPEKKKKIRPRNRSGGSAYPLCHIFLVSNILKYFKKKKPRSHMWN